MSRASSAAPALAEPLSPPPDLNKLVGRWDDLVERVRVSGKPMLASALEHASPVAVAANGLVTIELDEPNDIFAHSITTARTELTAMLREWFQGIDRIELRRGQSAAAPPKRLTDEDLRAQRIAALKKRDPILSAAIDALDLDVAD
jgi:hypothetical protein